MTNQKKPTIRVCFQEFLEKSQKLASRLNLKIDSDQNSDSEFFLQYTTSGLELASTHAELGKPIRIDFDKGANAHRMKYGGGRGQDIAKAVGLQKQSDIQVLDATAGLGRDAFVLASLGCVVTMIERNPVVYELLQDGLTRALNDPDMAAIIERMPLMQLDASLQKPEPVDVIYLDPMFPPNGKSAKVKKELRYLHHVVGYDVNADDLLGWAMLYAKKRVVVKRPRLAPFLGNQKPTLSFEGKSGRFDVYVISAF